MPYLRRLKGIAFLALICVAVISGSAAAQNWQGNLGFQLGFPTGDYKDQIDKTGIGVSGDFLWSPHRAPIGIGLSIGVMSVGHESRKEPFSTTVPDVTVDVATDNAIAQFMLLLRLQPKKGDVRPYADGLVGWNYLFTKTTIKNASNDEEVASSTNFDDNAFACGFGGGALIRVYDGSKRGGNTMRVYIDLNFRYILGGEAEYLKEGSIRRDSGRVTFDVSRSKTNIATTRLGVTIDF